jgi:hypothetical protein
MKKALILAILGACAMHGLVRAEQTVAAAPPPAASADGPLTFFKSYILTGDYVVRGVGLRGTGVNGVASGVIHFDDPLAADHRPVPLNADIMAAFLYWETVETLNSGSGKAGAKFRGNDISNIAVALNPAGTAPCWSSGGATGGADGAHKMIVYRADVARFLPIGANGKTAVNDVDLPAGATLDVALPDSGSGNNVPSTAGASLVIVYRSPSTTDANGNLRFRPLKSVVIYNGGFTLDHSTPLLAQKIRGFYQAANRNARLTHIVGDGQANFDERLLVEDQLFLTNPFKGDDGPASDPAWDDATFDVTLASPARTEYNNGPQYATTSVDTQGLSNFDCLSWGAIVFSTEVQDTDDDGLIDLWEKPQQTPLKDPNGQVLPNLYDMGARSTSKDVFFEIGYMATGGYANDAQTVPLHSHRPSKAVLDAVGDAYKNAPITNIDGTKGIRAHFDVGTAAAYQTNPPDPYIVPAALARGGEAIDETIGCTVDTLGKTTCPGQFPMYPGTVGWKTGYRFLRDAPLDDPSEPGRLRFDANRLPMFHYVLFAHNLGLPQCFGKTDANGNDLCVEGQPGFNVPTKTSGIADPPGGDILVTLGRWDDFTGTEYMQASSFFHEAGHNTGLRHGGIPAPLADGSLAFQPNCKPNYLSVMNYLFQVQGLVCDAVSTLPQCAGKAPGTPVIDYSRKALPTLDERPFGPGIAGLSEAAGLGTIDYRTRWYAPKDVSFVDNNIIGLGTTPTTRYCDGTPLPNPLPADWVPMVRIDGTSVVPGIDWNGDGVISASELIYGQDVTFSGANTVLDSMATGINGKPLGDDWANIDLRHVASRRNVAGLSLGVSSLDLSLGDPGKGDTGKGDTGKGDTGKGDTGKGDTGKGDTGKGDTGKGDTGSAAAPAGDLEFDTARAIGNAPTALTARNTTKSVTLTWGRPNAGTPLNYEVYRVLGTGVTPANFAARVLVGMPTSSPFVDRTVKNNTTYTYLVIAVFDDVVPAQRSGPSNFVTILVK